MNKHFYAMTFQYVEQVDLSNGDAGIVSSRLTAFNIKSTYVGYDDQLVTLPRMNAAKSGAEIPPNATLINLAYLGYMTHDQFMNKLE